MVWIECKDDKNLAHAGGESYEPISGCQAPPERCAWGAWECVMGAQDCGICGFISSCHYKVSYEPLAHK